METSNHEKTVTVQQTIAICALTYALVLFLARIAEVLLKNKRQELKLLFITLVVVPINLHIIAPFVLE